MKKLFITTTVLTALCFMSCEKEDDITLQNNSTEGTEIPIEEIGEIDESELTYLGREYIIGNPDLDDTNNNAKGQAKIVTSDWYELDKNVLANMQNESGSKSFNNLDFLKNRFSSVYANSKNRPIGIIINDSKFGKTKGANGATISYRSVGPVSKARIKRHPFTVVPGNFSVVDKNPSKKAKYIKPPNVQWNISKSTTTSQSISKSNSYSLTANFKVNDAFNISTAVTKETVITSTTGQTNGTSATYKPEKSILTKPGHTASWQLVKRKVQNLVTWANSMEIKGSVTGVYRERGFRRPRAAQEGVHASNFFYEYTDKSRKKVQQVDLVESEYYEYYIQRKQFK